MSNEDGLLQAFVRRSLSLSQDRLRRHVFSSKGEKLHRRFAFSRFEGHVDAFLRGDASKRWIVMSGLRGTGKTTLVAQLLFALSERGIPPARMPYASVDELTRLAGASLKQYLDEYERQMGKDFETLAESERVILFLDEVHYDPNWAVTLKILYDRTDRVFIFCTGSSSVSLQTSPDSVRRSESERLTPLSLSEYLLLKRGLKPDDSVRRSTVDSLFSSASAEDAYNGLRANQRAVTRYLARVRPSDVEQYLRVGTLPFTIPYSDQEDVYEKLLDVVEKTVCEDITMMMRFTKKMQTKMSNLIMLLAVSDRISYESICGRLGELTRPTLSRMIRGLEKSELVIAVRPFGRPVKKISKTPKYMFMAPSMRAALLWKVGQSDTPETTSGRLLEDAVTMYLYRLRRERHMLAFDLDASEGGADFVIRRRDKSLVVLEVGYGNKRRSQVEKTMSRTGSEYGIVVSDRPLSLSDDKRILSIPKEWFLLV
jgi:predicted AAA+ superfamily ATPase